jgi:hypothetical protein
MPQKRHTTTVPGIRRKDNHLEQSERTEGYRDSTSPTSPTRLCRGKLPIRTCRWCFSEWTRTNVHATLVNRHPRPRGDSSTHTHHRNERMCAQNRDAEDDSRTTHERDPSRKMGIGAPGGETSVHSRVFTLLDAGGASASRHHQRDAAKPALRPGDEHHSDSNSQLEAPPTIDAATAHAPRPRPTRRRVATARTRDASKCSLQKRLPTG